MAPIEDVTRQIEAAPSVRWERLTSRCEPL